MRFWWRDLPIVGALMSSRFVVCSWFADSQWLWMRQTIRVLNAHGHAHDFIKVAVDDDTSKPERILQTMDRHPRKIIVAIDIDSAVRGPLHTLGHIRGDVGLVMFNRTDRRGEPRFGARSGTVVVRPSRGAKRFLRLWAELSREKGLRPIDQSPLSRAIERVDGVVFEKLPMTLGAVPADQYGGAAIEFRGALDRPRRVSKPEKFLRWLVDL
jgi:hypothetical protein